MAIVYIIDGGPRKQWNTAQMCTAFAEGAKAGGAQAELIHLYDYQFQGCHSCFACKRKEGASYGQCVWPDAIHDLLQKVSRGDGLVIASPIYFGDVTGVMRCFLERLLFPFLVYARGYPTIAPKKLATAVLWTMNVQSAQFQDFYIGKEGGKTFDMIEKFLGRAFTPPERICACDTSQFEDYAKYVSDCWDPAAKAESRARRFPLDLEQARQAGLRMAGKLSNS